jgi:hypothetical protein
MSSDVVTCLQKIEKKYYWKIVFQQDKKTKCWAKLTLPAGTEMNRQANFIVDALEFWVEGFYADPEDEKSELTTMDYGFTGISGVEMLKVEKNKLIRALSFLPNAGIHAFETYNQHVKDLCARLRWL